MKTETNRKIWLGIGAFVVIGSGTAGGASFAAAPGATFPARTSPSENGPVMAQHQHRDREAGEAGEAKNLASLPRPLAFATRIALVRGHLLIGDELVRQQQWNAALPHFLHPSEELYGDIKDDLAQYNAPPFDRALKTLSDVVKAKRGGDAYSSALASLRLPPRCRRQIQAGELAWLHGRARSGAQVAQWRVSAGDCAEGSQSRSNTRTRAGLSGRQYTMRAWPRICRRKDAAAFEAVPGMAEVKGAPSPAAERAVRSPARCLDISRIG
jgi:hypothetical protein